MKRILILGVLISLIGCSTLQNPKVDPDPNYHSYILIQDQETKLFWLFFKRHIVTVKMGVDAFEIAWINMRILFTYLKTKYVIALGVKFLLTRVDYIRFLEWLMPGKKVEFQEVKGAR